MGDTPNATQTASSTLQYDLLSAPQPKPNAQDSRYIRHTSQTMTTRLFNGWRRPVRRVSITGVELTFDEKDRLGLLRLYGGKDDVAELFIVADVITIGAPLVFPQTAVTIVARELRFIDGGYIKTQPLDAPYRNVLDIHGQNGADGGEITLLVKTMTFSGGPAQRFLTRGAKGQDPDVAGYDTSPTRKDIKPITKADWDQVFSYANRKLRHELMFLDSDIWYYSEMAYPSYEEITKKFPAANIVYIELSNQYYLGYTHQLVSKPEVIAKAGQKEMPGRGGAAKTPGKPGVGGNGGRLRTLPTVSPSLCDLRGGISGAPLKNIPGQPGGTPDPAFWLHWHLVPSGKDQEIQFTADYAEAETGRGIDLGPAADAPTGAEATVLQLGLPPSAWVQPCLITLVMQYAKDCLAVGDNAAAVASLQPYVDALAAWPTFATDLETRVLTPLALSADVLGDSLNATQAHDELTAVVRQAKGFVDAFGNPPGWVPSLSLQSTVELYKSVLTSSMEEIYAAYYLERMWQLKTDKSEVLDKLMTLLAAETAKAKNALIDARARVKPAVGDLAGLVVQLEDLATKMGTCETRLRAKADADMASKEQRDAIAAGFKISAALIKALPVPEPFDVATSAFGSILDVTSGFIEKGGDDAAFASLKKQVDDFKLGKLAEEFNTDIDNDLKGTDADTKALDDEVKAFSKEQSALEKDENDAIAWGLREKELAEKAAKLEEAKRLVAAKKKPPSAINIATLDVDIATVKKEAAERKEKAAEVTADHDAAKKKIDAAKKALNDKKAKRAATIKTRVEQVKNLTAGIVSIAQTMNKLMVSQSQINSAYDAALAKLQSTDGELLGLIAQAKFLNDKKAALTQTIAQLTTTVTTNEQIVTKNLVLMNELRTQKAKSAGVLDPSLLTYVQSLGQDAHSNLRRFLYYVVKAYEYYTVKPWDASYMTAQRTFEGLRNIIEPDRATFTFASDETNKKVQLEKLLNSPEQHQTGVLTTAESALLTQVYQKPLHDMGKKIAEELARGDNGMSETRKPVTVGEADLRELNQRIVDPVRPNAIAFSLLRMHQIEASRERERILNIQVVSLKCRHAPGVDRFPDSVIVRFSLNGKSIVRADHRLYAFDPEVPAGADGVPQPGVFFETVGGKAKSSWTITKGRDGNEIGELKGDALWQADREPQENLLTTLLEDKSNTQLITLSRLRPGVFSDFVLSVDFTPAEAKVLLTELMLTIQIETGSVRDSSVFLSVDTNTDLAIPISVDRKDHSGRNAGNGRYVGFYPQAGDLAGNPLHISVPARYGRFKHTGWRVDGTVTEEATALAVGKSAYVTAEFIEMVPATAHPRVRADMRDWRIAMRKSDALPAAQRKDLLLKIEGKLAATRKELQEFSIKEPADLGMIELELDTWRTIDDLPRRLTIGAPTPIGADQATEPVLTMSEDECRARLLKADGWSGAKHALRNDTKTMWQLWAYRKKVVNTQMETLKSRYGFSWEAVGSTNLESDYDISITTHGTDPQTGAIVYDYQIVKAFNDAIHHSFKLQPGTLFDTNLYASAPITTAPAALSVTGMAMAKMTEAGQDVGALMKQRRYMAWGAYDRYTSRLVDQLRAAGLEQVAATTRKQFEEADALFQIAGMRVLDTALELARADVGRYTLGPNDTYTEEARACLDRSTAFLKWAEDWKARVESQSRDLVNAQVTLLQAVGKMASLHPDEYMRVSNELYVRSLNEVRALEHRAASLDIVRDRNAIEGLLARVKTLATDAVLFANEAYLSEGPFMHVVKATQAVLTAAKSIPEAERSEYIKTQSAAALGRLTTSQLLESFNEQLGDLLKDLDHYGRDKPGLGFYRSSKYADRLLDALLLLQLKHPALDVTLPCATMSTADVKARIAKGWLAARKGQLAFGADSARLTGEALQHEVEAFALDEARVLFGMASLGQYQAMLVELSLRVNAAIRGGPLKEALSVERGEERPYFV